MPGGQSDILTNIYSLSGGGMGSDHSRKGLSQVRINLDSTLKLTKSRRSAVLGHNIRFHQESTCLKAAVPEADSLGPESMVCAETRYEGDPLFASLCLAAKWL